MKVSLKTFMPIATAGMLSLASCETVQDRAKDYMSGTNRTQKELEEVTNNTNAQTIQYKLDSLAYRDIFNSTQAAKDSTCAAEFNKVAAKMRPETNGGMWDDIYAVDDKLIREGISIKEFNEIKEKDSWLKDARKRVNTSQHYADDWAYRKLFEKIGIMNDSIAKKCDEVSEKIRPY